MSAEQTGSGNGDVVRSIADHRMTSRLRGGNDDARQNGR